MDINDENNSDGDDDDEKEEEVDDDDDATPWCDTSQHIQSSAGDKISTRIHDRNLN